MKKQKHYGRGNKPEIKNTKRRERRDERDKRDRRDNKSIPLNAATHFTFNLPRERLACAKSPSLHSNATTSTSVASPPSKHGEKSEDRPCPCPSPCGKPSWGCHSLRRPSGFPAAAFLRSTRATSTAAVPAPSQHWLAKVPCMGVERATGQ